VYDVVIKSSRSLSHLLLSFLLVFGYGTFSFYFIIIYNGVFVVVLVLVNKNFKLSQTEVFVFVNKKSVLACFFVYRKCLLKVNNGMRVADSRVVKASC